MQVYFVQIRHLVGEGFEPVSLKLSSKWPEMLLCCKSQGEY